MTKEERQKLGKKLMLEEEKGMSETVRELGGRVMDEVFRLEQAGDYAEAKAFEAFLPVDADFLSSLAPLLGDDEFEKTMALYVQEKKTLRRRYLEGEA